MGNIFTIKHGTTIPTTENLQNYELGYSISDKGLYIKDETTGIIKLNDLENISGTLPLSKTTGTLPMAQGGTGAIDRANAIQNLLKLPINTVPAEDIPSAWAALGNFTCYYNSTSTVINKPTTYGTLIQIVDSVGVPTTLQQIWLRQGLGRIYTRGGTSGGWANNTTTDGAKAWYKYITDKDVVLVSQGGTGQTTRETGFKCTELNTNYVTLESQYCAYNAYTQMVHIRATVAITGYALSEGELFSVLLVPNTYRPGYTQAISVASGSGVICNGMVMTKDHSSYPGYIRIRLSESLLSSATLYLYINAQYFI